MKKNLTEIIEEVLRQDPAARNDDSYLYCKVCKAVNPAAMDMPFKAVIISPKMYGLPGYDTVTRLRRKIQAELEELEASEQVLAWRREREDRCRVGCFE